MIYLDYAATTPMSAQAKKIYEQVATTYYGNANSLHDPGSDAKQLLNASASTLADLVHADPLEIHFTSSATEANYLGIMALLSAKEGNHIITSVMEHSSVANVFDHLERQGYIVSRINVDDKGRLDMDHLKREIRKDTVMASIQYVNSELGVIQDIEQISDILNNAGVLIHTDAVQAFGRLPLDTGKLNIHGLTISGHKFYGPKGVGALYISNKADWKPVMPVSPGKRKLKEGTADVPSIVSMVTAAKEIQADMLNEQARISEFSKLLSDELRRLPYEMIIESDHDQKVPNILGLRFPGIEGQYLMLECNQSGMAISTGSACNIGSEEPSTTMKALNRSAQEAQQFVRLSFGLGSKKEQIPEIVQKMNVILKRHFNKVKEHPKKIEE
ncbi:IscS subfamily cysteine desulfurase [Balneola sp. MJW-20]|uniref:IscS subfamily cysteine desulfurase n=1 Tax=Gracilimonas aurantiaca TaxID=3234185 RepID=UPI003467017D